MPKRKDWVVYEKECSSLAQKRNYVLLGYVEPWNGHLTKLKLKCPIHGEWTSTSINKLQGGRGCPECKKDKVRNTFSVADTQHITDFMGTGKFPKGTVFTNTHIRNKGDVYWDYTCPICSKDEYTSAGVCNGVFRALGRSLKSGQLSCRCSKNYRFTSDQWTYRIKRACEDKGYDFLGWEGEIKANNKVLYSCPEHGVQTVKAFDIVIGHSCPACKGKNQKQAYINKILDESGNACALKFGIANNTKRRIKEQNAKNAFDMRPAAVYSFDDVASCRAAERKCLEVLECGVVNEFQLKDGRTETTRLGNYEIIKAIYESFGGVLQK